MVCWSGREHARAAAAPLVTTPRAADGSHLSLRFGAAAGSSFLEAAFLLPPLAVFLPKNARGASVRRCGRAAASGLERRVCMVL